MEHVPIYHEAGRFAGWPANYGIWGWDNELVVGFTLGHSDPAGGFHARDKSRPFMPMQARSFDGGQTWDVQPTPCETPGGCGLSADEHMNEDLHVKAHVADEYTLPACPGTVDFTHPDFALMCARSGLREGTVSWFYCSTDRCNSWHGPYRMPMFGTKGISARTDYLVNGPDSCMLFLTAVKENGQEGRIILVETTDGGKSFELVSMVGPEPDGFEIMPASLRISDTRLLTSVRCKSGDKDFDKARHSIDLFESNDNGKSWSRWTQPVPVCGKGGNPPTLTKLHDGRLCMTYGYRDEPFGIRARLSEDDGATWGDDIILRTDGGNHDIGYPRTIQRPDGTIVTVYYYNDSDSADRYLAATLWKA